VLTAGTQILEINGVPVSDVQQAVKLVRKGAANNFWICYRGQSLYIGIRVPND
jgi:hypothetical protein